MIRLSQIVRSLSFFLLRLFGNIGLHGFGRSSYFGIDVQEHHQSNVDEADDQDCLGLYSNAGRVLAEEFSGAWIEGSLLFCLVDMDI